MIAVAEIHAPLVLSSYREVLSSVMGDVVQQVHDRILNEARTGLRTGFADYNAGLQLMKFAVDPLLLTSGPQVVGTITLVGWLANAIEHGWEGADLKDFFKGGRSVKYGKDGKWYVDVPFRHGTPGTTGRSFQVMGEAHGPSGAGILSEQKAKALGKRLHAEARRLAATTTHSRVKHVGWGGRLPAGLSPVLRAHHVTDIHSGMVRMVRVYRAAEQSHYMTFRRASENSDPRAFVHPGISEHGYFRKTQAEIPRIAKFLLGNALRAVGGGR